MGQRNTTEQMRAYNEQARERQRRAGLRRHEIWSHDEDWPQIQRLAERLKAKRLPADPR